MNKHHLFAIALLTLGSYSANAQSTTTTTNKQTTVTPATPATPPMAPATMPTPAATTTTESTTTTTAPAMAQPTTVETIPADTKIKEKRNKTKVKPKN